MAAPCAIKLYAAYDRGQSCPDSDRLTLRPAVLFSDGVACTVAWDGSVHPVASTYADRTWGRLLGIVENRKQGLALLPARRVRDVPGQTFIAGTAPPGVQ